MSKWLEPPTMVPAASLRSLSLMFSATPSLSFANRNNCGSRDTTTEAYSKRGPRSGNLRCQNGHLHSALRK